MVDKDVPDSFTLQVVQVPLTAEDGHLEEVFSEFGPLKRCFVVRPKQPDAKYTSGIVCFAFKDDAKKAFKELNGSIQLSNSDYKIKFILDRPGKNAIDSGELPEKRDFKKLREDIEYAKKKRARLIIRNLSFKADEQSLRNHFEKCGKVVDVNILKKKDGKMVGCGFVQFSNVAEASKAIKMLNGKPMLQRPIAVDWAVPKKEYEDKSGTTKTEIKTEDENLQEDQEDEGEIEEEEEEDEDEEEEGEEEEEDDEEDYDEEEEDEKYPPRPRPNTGHDVAENLTVFVRNLNFDSEEEDLRALMEEYFGKVFFAVMVRDKMTERPKGTAFIKFRDSESVDKCLKASETDGIFLDGRQIYANMALAKEEADKRVLEKKVKEPKDTRNLYLAREGLIREGTQAAIGVSKADLEKRKQLEKYKRQMLKKLTMFVSPTRLCIRNLPPTLVEDKSLLKIIKKFSDHPGAKVTEARIMKDLKNGNQNKGYAFVAFSTHEAAISCLRALNNNPSVFTKDARPIVDFSIENRVALEAREKRQQKSLEKNPLVKTTTTEGNNKKIGKTKAPAIVTPKIEGDEKPKFMGSQGDPKIKNLPTHSGPKVRHNKPKISRKDLQKQENDKKKNKKRKNVEVFPENPDTSSGPAKRAKSIPPPKSEKKLAKIRKERQEEKKFSSLVESYKSKLISAEKLGSKSKWFE